MPVVSRLHLRGCEPTRAPRFDAGCESSADAKTEAKQRGVRGETFGYWYLRRQAYVFVARNYMPRGAKGETDLVGYHGDTLAFVEVRTRTAREQSGAAGTRSHFGEATDGSENHSPFSVRTPRKGMPDAF